MTGLVPVIDVDARWTGRRIVAAVEPGVRSFFAAPVP
jgi:hypothetical protein